MHNLEVDDRRYATVERVLTSVTGIVTRARCSVGQRRRNVERTLRAYVHFEFGTVVVCERVAHQVVGTLEQVRRVLATKNVVGHVVGIFGVRTLPLGNVFVAREDDITRHIAQREIIFDPRNGVVRCQTLRVAIVIDFDPQTVLLTHGARTVFVDVLGYPRVERLLLFDGHINIDLLGTRGESCCRNQRQKRVTQKNHCSFHYVVCFVFSLFNIINHCNHHHSRFSRDDSHRAVAVCHLIGHKGIDRVAGGTIG